MDLNTNRSNESFVFKNIYTQKVKTFFTMKFVVEPPRIFSKSDVSNEVILQNVSSFAKTVRNQ